MRMLSFIARLACLSAFALPACGGSQPPAEEPEEAASEGAEPKAEEKTEEKAEEPKEEKKSDSKPSDTGGPEVKRTAKDIITSPEVTFMFNFNASEPKEKAEKACSSAGDDPKKMAMCMKKASSKFQADGMQFKKDDKGEWVWIVIRRKGSTISVLHKMRVEFSDDKATSVVLKTSGKDLGKGPGKLPSEVTVEVPNEFEIAMKDPTHGRMVYEAKIGIMSDDKGK
jgi:hypothetical protein